MIPRSEVHDIDLSEVTTGETIGPVTPGEVLLEEFMAPLGVSARALGREIDVPLSTDHGFIVGCTGPDQCACAVAWVDAYNGSGVLVSHQHWLAPRCWRMGPP